jgi:competence protein ComEC
MSLKLDIWNVEHGNAISILTPNNNCVVQDLGTNKNVEGHNEFSPIWHLNENYRVDHIDALIITHPHRDHIDDILNFKSLGLHKNLKHFYRPQHINKKALKTQLEAYNKGGFFTTEDDLQKYKEYLKLHKWFNRPKISKNSPLNPMNNGGVKFEFFKPTKANPENLDNHSIVTVINYAGQKLILTGDNKKASWKELLKRSDFKKSIKGASIFFAPHHGRGEDSYYPKLFDQFQPGITIISDGEQKHTDLSYKYEQHSLGMPVYCKGELISEKKKCLITRDVNKIRITLKEEKSPYINVFPKKVADRK